MLSTVDDQETYLAEIRRVLAPQARFGLIVYCAAHPADLRLEPPRGDTFPTTEALDELLDQASLRVLASGWTDHFAALPADWQNAMATVQSELEHRHGDDRRWQAAEEQSNRMSSLLTAGEVRGRMLVLQAA